MRHWRILDMHGKTSATAGGICFSWTTNGGNGAWTSWPPHEHEKDLEEVYCYFDMDDPHFGLHLSYVEPGDTHGVVAHTVKSGTCLLYTSIRVPISVLIMELLLSVMRSIQT